MTRRAAAAEAPSTPPAAPYAIALSRTESGDGPAWVATVEELEGCEARGDSPEAAAAAVTDAIERWVQEAGAAGRRIPPPRAAAADHSGRLLVRMPKSLHAELARASERDGTSLNAFIVAALSASVGWRRPDGAAPEPVRPAAAEPAGPGGPGPQAAPEAGAGGPRPQRGVSLALTANLVVLAIAGVLAIALLITAWQG